MSKNNSLYDVAKRALLALTEEEFSQLLEDLRNVLIAEDIAHALHQFSLNIAFGGNKEATVYFSIEAGDLPDEWNVSEGAKVFYEGIDVTELFEGCDIDERIYAKSNEVEDMMAEKWADAKIAEYEANLE
jgi:hypothetical protein